MGSSANFRTVLSAARNANSLVAEPETNFNAKWPFKVIYFGIIAEPARGYIVQYNKYGLRCEDSEDSERKKRKSPFSTTPLSLPPLQQTPANIRIEIILLETRIPIWATFLSLIVWVYLHSNINGYWLAPKYICVMQQSA